MNALSVPKRHFVQFMLTNPTITKTQAVNFLDKQLNEEHSESHLKQLIIEINRQIINQHFKIVQTTCEVTGESILLWLNLKNDQISRLQEIFTPIELQYFHSIMQEIVTSEDHKILHPRAINISSTLTSKFSRDEASKVFEKWINGGYFIKKGGQVLLGPRTIVEFMNYLKNNTENCVCELCSQLVFTGNSCNFCTKTFHNFCLNKYMQKNDSCPNCKNAWQDDDNGVGESMEVTEEDDSSDSE